MLLALAPMDGYTDCPNRIIVKKVFDKYNIDDNLFFVTEFMSADGYVSNPPGVIQHMMHTEVEKPIWGQIFSGNRESLIQTAKALEEIYDYKGVDINIGCPSPRIVRLGAGSGMLKDKERTLSILKDIRDNIGISLTMKTRIGLKKDALVIEVFFCMKNLINSYFKTIKKIQSGSTTRQNNVNCELLI